MCVYNWSCKSDPLLQVELACETSVCVVGRRKAKILDWPLIASGLYIDPRSLRKSSYIGREVSAFMAL